MKHSLYALVIVLCGLSFASAEEPDAGPPRPPKGGPSSDRMNDKMKEKFMENLPPEIRQRFQAAREKALQDPKLQEMRKNADSANRQFFDAMRTKMMEIDPGLADLIKKQAHERGKGMKEGGREGRPDPGFGNLTPEERQKLMAAREKAKEDPVVQGAEKQKEQATTPEARKAAAEEFRKAMQTALLKVDPTLGPILEKMAQRPPPKPPGPGGDRDMMMPEN